MPSARRMVRRIRYDSRSIDQQGPGAGGCRAEGVVYGIRGRASLGRSGANPGDLCRVQHYQEREERPGRPAPPAPSRERGTSPRAIMTSLLSPTQEWARDRLLARWPQDHLFVLHGDGGTGKSTILRDLHHRLGGVLLTIRDLVDAMPGRHPLTLEEAFTQRLRDALTQYPHVLLDDLHLLTNVVSGCGNYPRIGWFDAHLEALRDQLARTDHKLVIVTDNAWRPVFTNWAHAVKIPDFQAADYAFFGRTFLGEGPAARLDFAQVHRFAPYLDAHQWRQVCGAVKADGALDTERFLAYLRSRSLVSNVDLGEVESVALS